MTSVPKPTAPFLDDARFQLFTGKGGVGKSTLVAGLAVQAAAQGRRPLIVELGHRTSMQAIFGVAELSYDIRALAEGVMAMKMEFERSLYDYFEQHVPVKRVSRAIVANPVLQRFFRAAPAVSEIATLAKLQRLVQEQRPGASVFRWDPILVDMDATGHALMLLDLPRVMDELVGDGPLRGLVSGFAELLRDRSTTRLNIVTLPRELPVSETCELYGKLEQAHRVPLGRLFVNRIPKPPLDEPELDLLARWSAGAHASGDTRLDSQFVVARRVINQCAEAQAQLEQLRARVELPLVCLPELGSEPARVTRDAQAWQTLSDLGAMACGRDDYEPALQATVAFRERTRSADEQVVHAETQSREVACQN